MPLGRSFREHNANAIAHRHNRNLRLGSKGIDSPFDAVIGTEIVIDNEDSAGNKARVEKHKPRKDWVIEVGVEPHEAKARIFEPARRVGKPALAHHALLFVWHFCKHERNGGVAQMPRAHARNMRAFGA